MMNKKYFYFADPHSFQYSFYVKLLFKRNNNVLIRRNDNSKWIEVKDYVYYGEPVKCIVPAQTLEYDVVLELLKSNIKDNVFGAINYMLYNYRERFLSNINSDKMDNIDSCILKYFGSTW